MCVSFVSWWTCETLTQTLPSPAARNGTPWCSLKGKEDSHCACGLQWDTEVGNATLA